MEEKAWDIWVLVVVMGLRQCLEFGLGYSARCRMTIHGAVYLEKDFAF